MPEADPAAETIPPTVGNGARVSADIDATRTPPRSRDNDGRDKMQRLHDIDTRCQNKPLYVPGVATDIYKFIREQEKKKLKGDENPIVPAKPRPTFAKERMRAVNFMFTYLDKLGFSSDTAHVALYYFDRFFEKYEGQSKKLKTVLATCLLMASKFAEIDFVSMSGVKNAMYDLGSSPLNYRDVFALEAHFFNYILDDYMAPTAMTFIHRFLQAVGMEENVSAVHTARYFATLAASQSEFTGHFNSKLAAAAAFIAYNKYNVHKTTGAPIIDYPGPFAYHTGYQLPDIVDTVLVLTRLAARLERCVSDKEAEMTILPVSVYAYYLPKCVTSTSVLPDFEAYFEKQGLLEGEEAA